MRALGMVWVLAVLVAVPAVAAERVWDQEKAKAEVEKVLELERSKSRPWNKIPWRKTLLAAASEAKKTGRPILVFFFVERDGPPLEKCGPEGRILRATSLSNPAVLSLIKSHYIPVKMPLEPGKEFPVMWPALERHAVAYKFSNARGFAGCSVVSPDLEVEYGSSGSAKLWELFDSTAFDAKKFAAMLQLAATRATEERALRAQRGLSALERQLEIRRFRAGMKRAVASEGRFQLPPPGFSLEKALELFGETGAK